MYAIASWNVYSNVGTVGAFGLLSAPVGSRIFEQNAWDTFDLYLPISKAHRIILPREGGLVNNQWSFMLSMVIELERSKALMADARNKREGITREVE